MLTERNKKLERELIGDIWQNSQIHENMLVLADEIGSRFAGTPSEKKAQEYMVKKLKEYGYQNARADPFTYYGWKRGPVKLEMTAPVQRPFDAISLAMSPGGTVEADVIYLGTGSPEEFEAVKPKDVQGKGGSL